jgi:hypothetical protein
MYDDITKQGHFTYEANYDNSWHFFDTDMEPDAKVLAQYNRPSVAYLKQHPEVTALAYHGKNPLLFERLVSSAIVGPSNEQTAPVATKFQSATKFLNYFSWLFGAMFILIRRRILVRKSKAFTWFKRKSTQFQPINASMQSREARA